MKRKLLLAVCLVLMFTTCLIPAQAEAELMPCRYVVPGTAPDDLALVDAAINEKLQQDGYNLDFQRIYVPWDVWQQKTNIMFATGEPFELIHIMEDWMPSSSYVALDAIVPIDEYIDQYAPTLKAAISEQVWSAAKINGKVYSIPVMFRDFSKMQNMTLQKQYFDKYSLPLPTTTEELERSVTTIFEGEADPALKMWINVNLTTPEYLSRASEKFPFTVLDSLVMVEQNGNLSPWLESEEFKAWCNHYRMLYELGYMPADILSIPSDTISAHIEAGDWIYMPTTSQFQSEMLMKQKPGIELVDVRLNPEKGGFYGQWIYMNANAVSATSPNPEAGVRFFDWLYKDQANYDLLNYGIEGTHWRDLGDRNYEVIPGKNGVDADYTFGDWEIGNYQFVRSTKGMSEEQKQMMFTFDAEAAYCVSTGFGFNPEAVSAEYNAVIAEVEASVFPVKFGVVAYEEGYDAMMVAMNAAGYQEVVAEYQRQFADFLAAK